MSTSDLPFEKPPQDCWGGTELLNVSGLTKECREWLAAIHCLGICPPETETAQERFIKILEKMRRELRRGPAYADVLIELAKCQINQNELESAIENLIEARLIRRTVAEKAFRKSKQA